MKENTIYVELKGRHLCARLGAPVKGRIFHGNKGCARRIEDVYEELARSADGNPPMLGEVKRKDDSLVWMARLGEAASGSRGVRALCKRLEKAFKGFEVKMSIVNNLDPDGGGGHDDDSGGVTSTAINRARSRLRHLRTRRQLHEQKRDDEAAQAADLLGQEKEAKARLDALLSRT